MFRVMGRALGKYINGFIVDGIADPLILSVGFDLNLFNKKQKVGFGEKEKKALVTKVIALVHSEFESMLNYDKCTVKFI